MTKWRVAALFLILSIGLHLAVIYFTRNWQSGNGYYLPYWPKWYVTSLGLILMFLGWGLAWNCSPLLRALVSEEIRLIKLWGKDCVFVRLDKEADALGLMRGKYPARKIKYQGIERRKRA